MQVGGTPNTSRVRIFVCAIPFTDCKCAGRFAALREIALGMDFFRRPASTYDPKSDPVVRVEAGRLRQRLDRYYHGEGAAAPFEILLDKGSYVARGNLGSTLDCLERHALRKANGAHCNVIDPTFAVLHHDPRWRSMLERVGLPDFSSRV
jgi:hypothetical protein